MADRRTPQPPRIAGRFSYSIIRRNRPRTLATWRATDTTPRTARHLAKLLGGHPQPDPATGQHEVITTTDTLDIILPGPEALSVHWERGAQLSCDGTTQNDGRPCVCPSTFEERRVLAKQGRGCLPRAEVHFRLEQVPRLGTFSFVHEDRSYVGMVLTAQAELSNRETGCAVGARLGLRRTVHRLRSGRYLAYTRPVLMAIQASHTPSRSIDADATATMTDP